MLCTCALSVGEVGLGLGLVLAAALVMVAMASRGRRGRRGAVPRRRGEAVGEAAHELTCCSGGGRPRFGACGTRGGSRPSLRRASTRRPASRLARAASMAWLTGCLGCALTIGSPRLVAWATCGRGRDRRPRSSCRACSRPCPAVSPTLASARLSTRCRVACGKLSRSSVSTAILTFFSVGTSSVVTSSSSSVSSNACRTCSSKAGGVSTTTKSKWLLSRLQDPADQRRRDGVLGVRLHRRDQRARRPRGCVVSSGSSTREVEAALEVHRVGDRARREQLQGDRDVAEGQVEVDQADPVRRRGRPARARG